MVQFTFRLMQSQNLEPTDVQDLGLQNLGLKGKRQIFGITKVSYIDEIAVSS